MTPELQVCEKLNQKLIGKRVSRLIQAIAANRMADNYGIHISSLLYML